MSYSPNLLRILGIKLANELTKDNLISEQRVFKAILIQALEDAMSNSVFKRETYWKHDAHRWFLDNGKDFQQICWSADIDPEFIRGEYIRLCKERKIVFSKIQATWIDYRELYKMYRNASSKEERKKIKKLIEKIRFH